LLDLAHLDFRATTLNLFASTLCAYICDTKNNKQGVKRGLKRKDKTKKTALNKNLEI